MPVRIVRGAVAHRAVSAGLRIVNGEDSPTTAGFRSFAIYKGEQEISMYESLTRQGLHSVVLINAHARNPIEVEQQDFLAGENVADWAAERINLFLAN